MRIIRKHVCYNLKKETTFIVYNIDSFYSSVYVCHLVVLFTQHSSAKPPDYEEERYERPNNKLKVGDLNNAFSILTKPVIKYIL